jgi:hypothetical protein
MISPATLRERNFESRTFIEKDFLPGYMLLALQSFPLFDGNHCSGINSAPRDYLRPLFESGVKSAC